MAGVFPVVQSSLLNGMAMVSGIAEWCWVTKNRSVGQLSSSPLWIMHEAQLKQAAGLKIYR